MGKLLISFFVFNTITLLFMAQTARAGMDESSEEIINKSNEAEFISSGKGSIVPVPIPVSNPTVGTGLQAAILYMHPGNDTEPDAPNKTSGVAGMYTSTKSWLAGAFHDGNFLNDKIRLTAFIGLGDLNLKFYGIGDNPVLKDHPISYGLEMFSFSPKVLYRLFEDMEWFAGVSYVYIDSRATFHTSNLIPGVKDLELDFLMSGVGLIGMYDSRNDNYYPTHGGFFEFKLTNFAELWGSDSDFNKFKIDYKFYRPVAASTTLAFRSQLEMSEGDVPFFALSRLNMHGFSTSRYTDRHTLSLHAEVRHKFHSRWGVVGFAEAGQYASKLEDIFDGETIVSGGAGIRWQVVRDKTMHLGLDFAVSNDDSAVYVQIGEHF